MATKKPSAAPKPAAPAPAPARVTRPATITLSKGETFAEAAKRAGVSSDALFAANRDVLGSTTDRAQPGTALVVPQED